MRTASLVSVSVSRGGGAPRGGEGAGRGEGRGECAAVER